VSGKNVIDEIEQAIAAAGLDGSPQLTEDEVAALFVRGMAEIATGLRAANQSIENTLDKMTSDLRAHTSFVAEKLHDMDQRDAERERAAQIRRYPPGTKNLLLN
jgi:hypothetical protein